jgi:amino acid adenylation domain-containing protein
MLERVADKSLIPVNFDPFAGPTISHVAPTTEPQREIWLACMFGGNDASRAYNESVSLRFSGVLNPAAFEQAWQALVNRHEALRSAFSGNGEQMVFFEDIPIPLVVHDFSTRQLADQEQLTGEILAQDTHYLFDLTNGPLVKASLIVCSETAYLFTLTAHHLVCDGWSIGILMQDLGAFYSAFAQQKTPNLPPSDLFSQYAVHNQEFLQSTDYQQIEEFWISQFSAKPTVLNLPTETPRLTRRTYASRRLDFRLDQTLVQAVRQTSAKLGCSLVTTLTAMVEILLHQLTGQTDIVLGLPAAGQSVTDFDRLVGHCVNLLPLRSAPKPGLSFRAYLQQRKTELLDVFENQQLTFGSLLKKLALPRDSSRVTLVPVVFNVDIGLADKVVFYGLDYKLISNPRAFENFELFLNATGTAGALQLEWSYNTALFSAERIGAFHAQFVDILQTLTTTPDALIGVKSIPKNQAVLSPSNPPKPQHFQDTPFGKGPQLAYDKHRALSDFLCDTAQQFPDKIALRFGTETLTFAALNQQANQLAWLLQANGIKPGNRVGIALERSIELIVSLIAVMKTGAAYVPIDPRHPDDRIAYVLADADCRVLLTNDIHRGRFGESAQELIIETIWPTLSNYDSSDLRTAVSGNDLLYVLYTSGTTGRPKGVQIRHRNMANLLLGMQQQPGLTAADKTVLLATIAFDVAMAEIFLPLLVGAELVIVGTDIVRNGSVLAELLHTEAITFVQATPATWRMLLDAGWHGNQNLRIISTAEALPYDIAQKLLPCCRELWNLYGPTEITVYATAKRIHPDDERVTIGKPITNTEIFILPETTTSVLNGHAVSDASPDQAWPGEICIGGDGVAIGYLNQPELTAEKFVQHPISGQRLYRTGDLGRFLPNGDIDYLGRIDEQIKIRGYRVEPAEIEQCLLQQPEVRAAVVVAREDRPGDKRLVAYLVTQHQNGQLKNSQDPARLWREALKQTLPGYMIPSQFVVLPKLPVTANGKLDKKALPDPNQSAFLPKHTTTETEAMLLRIWQQLLGIETISIDDDFFELGGHSLIAVQVMTRIEVETGRRLPLSTLFDCATIRELAQLLDNDTPASTSKSLVPIRPQGSLSPIYVIHGIGLNLLNFQSLVAYMNPEQPIYGLQARGLDGTEEPLDSMEAIAAVYLSEVMAQNPTGPYALAGYSFGGYVAYEMARQLHAMGREVKLLGMFDTNAQELVTHRSAARRLLRKIARQFPKMIWIGESLLKRPMQTIHYQRDYVLRQVNNLLCTVGLAQPTPETEADHLNQIIEKHEIAYKNYVLQPYNGTLDLFRASERLYFVDDFQYLGWKDYALGGVRVHNVPGDHQTLMLPPNDKILAEALQQALDRR